MWSHLPFAAVLVCLLFGKSFAEPSGFVEGFEAIGADWHVAEYDFTHPFFDTDWRRSQVIADGQLTLRLAPKVGAGNRFSGGSIRRNEPSHYGRYEVILQPAKGEGAVTGFFTYTGPAYGTRHDEIDIEFLGRDTTKLNIAWFVDGEMTDHLLDLGFDAAERPRLYAFEWRPDGLRWFVDNTLVFKHNVEDGPIPRVPSMLFVNLWAADNSISDWSGRADDDLTTNARVEIVRFIPLSDLEAETGGF